MTSSTVESTFTHSTERTPWSKPLQVAVVFGNPERACQGTGICRVQLSSHSIIRSREGLPCTVGIAWIWPPVQGAIRMVFPKHTICLRMRNRQFGNGIFSLPAPVALPPFPAAGPDRPGPTLLPGDYPIEETPTLYKVTFSVQ